MKIQDTARIDCFFYLAVCVLVQIFLKNEQLKVTNVTTIDNLRMVAFVRPHIMKSKLCREILNTTSTMINK